MFSVPEDYQDSNFTVLTNVPILDIYNCSFATPVPRSKDFSPSLTNLTVVEEDGSTMANHGQMDLPEISQPGPEDYHDSILTILTNVPILDIYNCSFATLVPSGEDFFPKLAHSSLVEEDESTMANHGQTDLAEISQPDSAQSSTSAVDECSSIESELTFDSVNLPCPLNCSSAEDAHQLDEAKKSPKRKPVKKSPVKTSPSYSILDLYSPSSSLHKIEKKRKSKSVLEVQCERFLVSANSSHMLKQNRKVKRKL